MQQQDSFNGIPAATEKAGDSGVSGGQSQAGTTSSGGSGGVSGSSSTIVGGGAGQTSSGGSTGTGGQSQAGTSGGASGGFSATGGSSVIITGGNSSTGGASTVGGAGTSTGGSSAITGGASAQGGTSSTGGFSATGGLSGTGGGSTCAYTAQTVNGYVNKNVATIVGGYGFIYEGQSTNDAGVSEALVRITSCSGAIIADNLACPVNVPITQDDTANAKKITITASSNLGTGSGEMVIVVALL